MNIKWDFARVGWGLSTRRIACKVGARWRHGTWYELRLGFVRCSWRWLGGAT